MPEVEPLKHQRVWIDIIDPPLICGVLSVLPFAYVGGCLMAQAVLSYWCKGDTVIVLLAVFSSVPLSAIAGAYGSRYWWSVTAIALGMLLFFVFRLH
jgi:hypothetical protein